MEEEFLELVGIIIGDGNLWSDERHFRIEVTGDLVKDRDFIFNHVSMLMKKFTLNKVVVKERSGGLRARVTSKEMFMKFINFGFSSRIQKLNNLEFLNTIPLEKRKSILRGLMDTDGCVVKRSNNQVFMEIATSSEFLANWINNSLNELGFRAFVTKHFQKKCQTFIFRVWLSGKENIMKWKEDIGFSNKFKLDKAISILN